MVIYKAAIVGLGRIGNLFDRDPKIKNKPASHTGCYLAHDNIELIAGCDINNDRLEDFRKDSGIDKLYTDYKEMFDKEDIDILSICTHNDSHRDICLYACEKGVKAIFCEKPMAMSLKECDEMIETCKNNNVHLVIDHTRRFDNSFILAKKLLDSGKIGEIQKVDSYATVGLLNGGSHLFDLLRYYVGDAEWVSGKILHDETTDPGAYGVIGFKNGVHATFDCRWRDYCHFKVDLIGSKGILSVGGMIRSGKNIELFKIESSEGESGIYELKEDKIEEVKSLSPYLNAVKNIVEALNKNEINQESGYDGKAALEIAMAFYESHDFGGNVKVKLPLNDILRKVKARETSFTKDGRLLR
ncbi:Gfo/Idh/MocA family oxidoreductase [Candidatus Woesearchaeota archaeon]|nr:Gfo/Idh/MocA family oxidoreductase [Candidatus Woesearchaeota archaeon]